MFAHEMGHPILHYAAHFIVFSVVLSLIGDWLLQSEWISSKKLDWRQPAAWLHGAIHAWLLLIIFPWPMAVAGGLLHLWIDTRKPVEWLVAHLRPTFKSPDPNDAKAFLTWLLVDQAAHMACLIILSLASAITVVNGLL